ncbi:MAG: MFS transporter [Pseudomonadota bacterium]
MPAPSRALPVLIAASTTQFAAAVGFWGFGLLAPELAAETGLNERDFGLSVTFIFMGTLLSSSLTGVFVRRYGGPGAMVRFLAAMIGAVLLTLSGTWTGTMIAAFLFGLGYGPQGPVGMTLVTQATPPERRGLYLALRHSSVPLAASSIGRLLPPLMVMAGWQSGVLSIAGVLALVLMFSLLAQSLFHVEAAPARHKSTRERFRALFVIPGNLRFLWGTGLVFALTQTGVTTFSYIYLLEVAELSAVEAGIFASNLHLTALFGRPALGWLTDRVGNPQKVLAGIAVVTVTTLAGLLQVGPETPPWVLIPLAAGCGIAGQCWNSVFVTAMSFKVASDDLAELNGRAFAFLSIGWMISPPLIWALVELSGGYAVPLVGLASINVAVFFALLAIRDRAQD